MHVLKTSLTAISGTKVVGMFVAIYFNYLKQNPRPISIDTEDYTVRMVLTLRIKKRIIIVNIFQIPYHLEE